MNTVLPDVHKDKPKFQGITLNRVGVDNVMFPLLVRKKDGGEQLVEANFSLFSSLKGNLKGTNMSRFSDELNEKWSNKAITGLNFKELLHSLRTRIQSKDVYVSAEFNYPMTKIAPVSKKSGIMYYSCKFIGIIFKYKYVFITEVTVPVSSYCPCSKEMSLVDKINGVGRGAHNQRGMVTIQVKTNPPQPGIWLEDLISVGEKSGSCEVYPILKRPDEKFVTEKGYGNPKFVEDMAREVIYWVRHYDNVVWARTRVRNYESIHPHNAVAYVEQTKKGNKWFKSDKGFV